jgi:hypothetical protein
MKYQADMYNDKMGIGRSSEKRRQRSPRDNPRRSGYAYRYVDDDESPPVVDIDTTVADVKDDEAPRNQGQDVTAPRSQEEDDSKPRRREQSWEERALAVERVPPANMAAWGPSGKLPVDVRTKAIMDALEDVATASRKLEAREKKETLAREDITILKV